MKRDSRTLTVKPCRTPEEWKSFVERCDDDLEMRMDAVARQVASIPELRFIGLTGPTCSGKTTAARKLTECLEEYGHRVHVISIDDFYYDKDYLHEMAEDDPDVEIDYDSEATIDIELLREKVEALMACRETRLPRFDFQTGYRVEGKLIQPRESDVFLFEGIQVLYPKVREILNRGIYRCIYIYPASSIEQGGEVFDPEELRLMRRFSPTCTPAITASTPRCPMRSVCSSPICSSFCRISLPRIPSSRMPRPFCIS